MSGSFLHQGSGEGSSNADPPFEQLKGDTEGGWRDKAKVFASGAFNSIAPDFMKQAISGAGDIRAFQKRRDMSRRAQRRGPDEERRQRVRDEATQRLQSYSGGE